MWQTNKFVATTYAAPVVNYEQVDNITDCFHVVNVSLVFDVAFDELTDKITQYVIWVILRDT